MHLKKQSSRNGRIAGTKFNISNIEREVEAIKIGNADPAITGFEIQIQTIQTTARHLCVLIFYSAQF